MKGKYIKKFTAKDGTKVKLRYPKFSDWKDFLKLINSAVEEEVFILKDKKITPNKEKEWVRNLIKGIKKGEKISIVAEVNGEVVGHCAVNRKRFRENHIGVMGILVRKDYRGKGIGKALMKTAIEEAKKKLKVKILTLSVVASNLVAYNLYKKLGFKEYGVLRKAYRWKNKYLDEIFLAKYLK